MLLIFVEAIVHQLATRLVGQEQSSGAGERSDDSWPQPVVEGHDTYAGEIKGILLIGHSRVLDSSLSRLPTPTIIMGTSWSKDWSEG